MDSPSAAAVSPAQTRTIRLPARLSFQRLLERVEQAQLVKTEALRRIGERLRAEETTPSAVQFADLLLRERLLTPYQIVQLGEEQPGPLFLGEYVILDKLGEGGMG